MNIWIDLVNSPHIPFFIPIIKRLEAQNHRVFITYRDFAQTAPLVAKHQLPAVLIGDHKGKNKFSKVLNLLSRTKQLISYAKHKKIDLALSHNSYFQIMAAKALKIPCLTSMDFEGQPANHLAFRLASLVSVPSAFPQLSLKKFGAKRVVKYQGLKENICLADFSFQANYIDQIQHAFKLTANDLTKPLVVVRPPPTLALYHNGDETLFEDFLKHISQQNISVLVLPRVVEQKKAIVKTFPNFFFSDEVLDGLQLIANVDAVVSGGGSMNREAACLGTPAISFFSGDLPAVDQVLQQQGKLEVIKSAQQLNNLSFCKKTNNEMNAIDNPQNQLAINDFYNHINSLLKRA
jgi:uncharacterized protein